VHSWFENSHTIKQEIFAVKNLHTPFLELPAIASLNFVAKVCDVKDIIVSRFPQLIHKLQAV